MRLAVIAHIRHSETQYDALLARDYYRWDARYQVEDSVDRVLARWGAAK
ncbi:MAG: DUF2293 domain-containing protein [candidate division Zixibacteria bacterium]|nr:DUF2293 domain-containing protein [candidate division Zixibacteria bacterium]